MPWAYLVAWGLQVLVMLGGPVVVAVWFARRYGVRVTPFLFGAAVFLLFQILTRIPLVQVAQVVLVPSLGESVGAQVAYLAVLALTAGLFESVGRWLGYRVLFGNRLERSWKNAVAYGLGHAAMESAGLIGLSQAFSYALVLGVLAIGYDRLEALLPAELTGQLQGISDQIAALPWYLPLWGALERMLTLGVHVGLSLIVLQAFARKQALWLWVAVGLHALVDFTAPAMLQFLGWPVWVVELYVAVWAAAGVWMALRLRPDAELAVLPAAGEAAGSDT